MTSCHLLIYNMHWLVYFLGALGFFLDFWRTGFFRAPALVEPPRRGFELWERPNCQTADKNNIHLQHYVSVKQVTKLFQYRVLNLTRQKIKMHCVMCNYFSRTYSTLVNPNISVSHLGNDNTSHVYTHPSIIPVILHTYPGPKSLLMYVAQLLQWTSSFQPFLPHATFSHIGCHSPFHDCLTQKMHSKYGTL